MTREKKAEYQSADTFRHALLSLAGGKFQLDCGHHVTLGAVLGNDLVIRNGKSPRITCSDCGQ